MDASRNKNAFSKKFLTKNEGKEVGEKFELGLEKLLGKDVFAISVSLQKEWVTCQCFFCLATPIILIDKITCSTILTLN